MENLICDTFSIKVNGESYELNQKLDVDNGVISYFLPLNGTEDFYQLVEIINKYNPPTSIFHNPWEDLEEEKIICDRMIKYNNYCIVYRFLCDMETGFVKINFNTNGNKDCENFIRKYISILLYHTLLEKKNRGLNDEVQIKR